MNTQCGTCGQIPTRAVGASTNVWWCDCGAFEIVPETATEADRAIHGLPDTNPKTAFGVQKTPLHLIPAPALLAEAEVFGLGAKKYGAYNWREHSVSASVYVAAALRHLLAWQERQDTDAESGQSHLAHVRACMGILLDAGHHGKLNDDRPIGGPAA